MFCTINSLLFLYVLFSILAVKKEIDLKMPPVVFVNHTLCLPLSGQTDN